MLARYVLVSEKFTLVRLYDRSSIEAEVHVVLWPLAATSAIGVTNL